MQLLAQHCYVQLGASAGSEAVQELLPSCIPSKLYRTRPPERWASLVTAAHAKVSLHRDWALGLCGLLWGGGGASVCRGLEASHWGTGDFDLPASLALSLEI